MIEDEKDMGLHPFDRILARLNDEVGDLSDLPLLDLDPAEARTALVLMSQVRALVDEVTMKVAVHAVRMGAGLDAGAASTGSGARHQLDVTEPGPAPTVRGEPR